MNWKRAVIAGIILWILIFFEVSILMFGFGLQTGNPNYYFIHFLLLTIFIIGVNYFYFRKKNERGFVQGLYFGLVMIAVGIILDAVITVPLFVKDYKFLISWEILASYLEALIICGLYGYLKSIKKRR